jgi:excisionase family DNA binding protein
MKEPPTPLYVRLAAEQARRLEEAVSVSGKSKRQLIEDAVREHLTDDGLTVGRIALSEQMPEVLTAPEAAALLRIEESDLLAAAARGELPARAIGEDWRFSRLALLSWLRGEVKDTKDLPIKA